LFFPHPFNSCLIVSILFKPVDFTSLKAQTKGFLREMLLHIFINSQRSTPTLTLDPKDIPTTRDHRAIEEIFIKAMRLKELSMGLVYFLTENFRDLSDHDPKVEKLVKWASSLARDTVRTGIDIVPENLL
jgi:nucleolar MIF4G domain-containing protein 1